MSDSAKFIERRWTSQNGLSLFARDYPAVGPATDRLLPVICLHGLTRNSRDFEDVAPMLAEWGRRVIAPDVRGRGLSDYDSHPENYQPKIYVRDLLDMMDSLEIPKAVFVGTSMGGIITMALMAKRPKAVAAAILNDVGPAVAPEGIARILSYAGQPAVIRDWNDAAAYVERTNSIAMPNLGNADWDRFARRTFREKGGVPVLDYDPAISVPLSRPPSKFAGWVAQILFRRLARRRPTMLIRGALSDIITDEIAQKMQRAAPSLTRVDVPGVGHAPLLTELMAVDAMEQFLRTLPRVKWPGGGRIAVSSERSPSTAGDARANVALAFLLLAYIFNFLDRQILGILASPIKADLGLSDAEFGAIGGLAFALLYSVLGVPLALLADRTSRSGVIASALAVWSGFTALCGAATGYWQLFLCRLGVGVGEAGGVAPSYALIADYFPLAQRARALAIYSLGIPIGLAGGTLLGAYIANAVSWRAAFFVMGGAGVLFAPIFKYFVRDLPRASEVAGSTRVAEVFGIVARKRSFWLMAFAASFSSLCGYGLALWTPSILMRSFDFDLLTTGRFLASLLLIGGSIGVFAGGWLADRLGRADRRWYAWLPAIAWIVTAPLFVAGFLSTNMAAAWLLLLLPNALNILWLGPVTAAVQHLAPQPMRATASASFLLINNLIGLGVGPLLIGALSDHLKSSYGADSLRYASIAALSAYVLAAFLMLLAARTLRQDWVEDETA